MYSMSRFKKFSLSIAVILVFIAYSLQQRNDDSSQVVKPIQTTTTTTTASSPTVNTAGTTAPAPSATASSYKDGTYVGSEANAFYGFIRVKATISGGKLTDVVFLEYPNDRGNSVEINSQAMPYLRQEAIQAQSAHVNTVTGATDTSQAFIQSLSDALSKAQQG